MDTVIRVVIIYVFLIIAMRVLGKREFNQLSPMELVSLLLIPEIVSNALNLQDNSLINAFIGVTTLFSLVFFTSLLVQRSHRAQKIISGEPVVLVRRGLLLHHNISRERMTPDEIYTEMREAGFERIEQIKWAVLEPDGKISFIPQDGETGTPANKDDKPSPA